MFIPWKEWEVLNIHWPHGFYDKHIWGGSGGRYALNQCDKSNLPGPSKKQCLLL